VEKGLYISGGRCARQAQGTQGVIRLECMSKGVWKRGY